ncbi:hypothetical protein B296_00028365 [Ensete ventricosum]|uniref:Uncharacterized protein n=1 Tax=Ensete ventricosum TaxID=4639 RepID=A0A426Z7E4_ENSVE|nr:hypothetical protein B296_00028365 [Ensete ventricosum]
MEGRGQQSDPLSGKASPKLGVTLLGHQRNPIWDLSVSDSRMSLAPQDMHMSNLKKFYV